MKRFFLLVALLCMAGAPLRAENYKPTPENLQSRRQFSEDRFGIFIHWGIYSTFAQGEWYLQDGPLRREEYAKAANAFYPHAFDAKAWAKVFKKAGARYITFTTRHHDGFSMWNTRQSEYNIMHTPYGKDVVAQLSEACRENNLALHLYYSHIDWMRDDYPMGRTGRGVGKDTVKADWPHYFAFMNRQLTELLTQYGPVRAIWFDGWWDHDQTKPAFDWQLPEQYALIHRLQPACLVGNNHHQQPNEGEDLQFFERDVPGENKAGLSGQAIGRLPLETCETMNGMWGYKVADQNYKSADQLIQLLVRTASKGANLLLNVGPQPDGNLPAAAVERLEAMGEWLQVNGESIYGTVAGSLGDGKNVVSTRRGKKVYVHILDASIKMLDLPCSDQVKKVYRLGKGMPLSFKYGRKRLSFAAADEQVPDRIYV
ncbi:MAG: alpha-L-fucosidase, partial [Prevotellaceae bacterium]|nr:alpha-L-fucosidase [Prevotellaceae bacterium]